MMEISIDWIEITLFTDNVDLALEWFEFNEYDFEEWNGKYGYKRMLHHKEENVYFLFDGGVNMNVHVSIAGHSIMWMMEHLYKAKDVDILFIKFLLLKGRFTRLDLACDDVDKLHFTIPKIKALLHKGAYVGRFRQFTEIDSYEDSGQNLKGETIYCGQRISEMMLRIYNKQLEHDEKLPDEPKDPVKRIRWELEIKHNSADAAARLVDKMNDLSMAYHALLTGYIRFIELDNSRKSRCSVLKAWLDFTDEIPAARIVGSKKILNIDQKKRWMWKSLARSVAEVNAADPEFMSQLVEHGNSLL